MSLDLKIDGPDRAHRADGLSQGVLGHAEDRPDGWLKVAGTATYAAEGHLDGLLHGMLVRAPGIGAVSLPNLEKVRAMEGVRAVLHDDRMVRNAAQGTANEAPVQGVERADYVGQPVALVVAESFEQARHAAQTLEVVVASEDTPPVLPDAVDPETPDDHQTEMGDLDRAMKDAAVTVDAVYTTPSLVSAAMEPHAATAQWDGVTLTLRGSLQMLKFNRNELADTVGLEPAQVRLLAPYVGGGFGSKLGISADCVGAALAAMELGQPVRVVQHRRQVFEVNTRRSETRQHIRLAADDEGRLTGLGHEALVSQLPDEEFSEPVIQGSHFAYAAANRSLGLKIARVHRGAAGSVRAPGEAVGVTAFEAAMDELAVAARIDPLDLRLRNIPECDPESGKPFSSHRLEKVLREGAEAFGWSARNPIPRSQREGEWWIGTGMAAAFRVNSVMEAEARIRLTGDGAVVETDMTDIGTGSYAIFGQIAAELLGLPLDRVDVELGDTDFPPGSGSGGSFGAASTGTAVWLAAMDIRRELAERLDCPEEDLTLKDGIATVANRRVPVKDLLGDEPLAGQGHVEPGDAAEKVRQATFGAHFAEVAVSEVTGEVRVRRMLGAFAAGRILNPRTARSQCHGGMTWGIGMALTEELSHDRRDGHAVNRDFAGYHLPVNADVPPLEVHFVEERDDWAGPMQAKGIGELSICGAGASILNAIHNACGARIRDFPATPDRVLAALTA
ncbi:xanthine dehydrogenase family protein molybdopterin-binding subunit [Maritimibacter sp. DP1N21-5]|uniref:xanthine dehydrogenase family protein molybdopterin-binding subunit n=1 Tax=Maritimibacter sp. DP1N21-5 TaxID=2836867 RepID=UPI001C447228|nr:xanthine dehydrogenase family protein molybdopterin-binding subunit [Maritimibacter sp. DP1N21-5]MBV7410726.1 xanthine dehydrogenase family protein molybdopterin-binding subunit [Maritimibacter sp. DP1N21-5]